MTPTKPWAAEMWDEFLSRHLTFSPEKATQELIWLGEFTAGIPCLECRVDFKARLAAKPPDLSSVESYKEWCEQTKEDVEAGIKVQAPSSGKKALVLDTSGGGLGDVVVMAWIAEGAKETRVPVHFTRGPKQNGGEHAADRILRMFGQILTDQKGPELHQQGGGFTSWGLRPENVGIQLDRTRLWQKRIGMKVEPKRPVAFFPEEAVAWSRQVRESACGKPLVAIFPFAAWKLRNWNIHKWLRLARHMEANGIHTVAVHPFRTPEFDLLPRTLFGHSIEHVAALCAEADLVVGNASGAAVLAGTLGTPTVAVTGSDDPLVSFGYAPEILCVHASAEKVPCVGCRFRPSVGFGDACNHGCEALDSLPWRDVYDTCVTYLRDTKA